MTRNRKPVWQLKLHRRRLQYGRLDKRGEVRWAKKNWKIQEFSLLPKGLFYLITSFVMRCFKEVRDKSFEVQKKAILKGICEVALACGCKCKFNSARGDVTLVLDGHRFLALQILDFRKHADAPLPVLRALLRERRPRFEEMERESRAVLRVALVVVKGGFVKLVPGRTRSD